MVSIPAATGPLLAAIGCLALAPRAARCERVENGDVAFGVVAGLLLAALTGSLATSALTTVIGLLAWPVLLLLLEMEDVRLMPALGALLFTPVPLGGWNPPAFALAAVATLGIAMALDTLAQREAYLPAITVRREGSPDFPNFINLPTLLAIECLALSLAV